MRVGRGEAWTGRILLVLLMLATILPFASLFLTALHTPWKRLPAAAKQLLRDNATTLIGDARDQRIPFSRSDAEEIKTPTLFIGGAATRGLLPKVLHALAAHVLDARIAMIAGATHAMFEQAPQKYCEIVLDFLAR